MEDSEAPGDTWTAVIISAGLLRVRGEQLKNNLCCSEYKINIATLLTKCDACKVIGQMYWLNFATNNVSISHVLYVANMRHEMGFIHEVVG